MVLHLNVYVDESGDLGFTPKSSKTFVVVYLIPRDPWRLRKDLNRLRKKLSFKHNEFKFSRDSKKVREEALKKVREEDLEIGVVAVDKSYVKAELKEQTDILYNYLVVHYMIVSLVSRYAPTSISLTLDRCLSGSFKAAFDNYMGLKVSMKTSKPMLLSVEHIDSQAEPCLQAADYISGACFSKFEHNNVQWYDLIKSKIQFKTSWGHINW